MDGNVYQAPNANLVDETKEDHKFYVVSPRKFWVLSISTMGLYGLYWFYKNWSLYKDDTGNKIWPIPRAIFSIFFTHSLFRLINKDLIEKQEDSKWSHGSFATLFVAITVSQRVADRFIEISFGPVVSTLVTMLSIPAIAWVLYQAQVKINLVCDSVKGEANDNLTPVNFIWIGFGSLLWLVFFASILVFLNPELFISLNN